MIQHTQEEMTFSQLIMSYIIILNGLFLEIIMIYIYNYDITVTQYPNCRIKGVMYIYSSKVIIMLLFPNTLW